MRWFMKISFLQIMGLGHIGVEDSDQPWPELSALTSARSGPSTSHGGWFWRDGILEDTEIEKFFDASANL